MEDLIKDTIDNEGWDTNKPTQEEYEERLQQWLNKKKGNAKEGVYHQVLQREQEKERKH